MRLTSSDCCVCSSWSRRPKNRPRCGKRSVSRRRKPKPPGYSLIHLAIREEAAGLGGRVLLTLEKRNQTLDLPWTRLGVGTPVLLSEEGTHTPGEAAAGWRGVVSRLQRDAIQVAFVQWPEPEAERPTFRLDRSTDEISRLRQRQALENAQTATESRLAEMRDILLGTQCARLSG